jgi:methyltransferase-like protein/2-polyprenyl-3-methyl-5-hydroxy-6-metoxy-1,4-benzoquinol methylase
MSATTDKPDQHQARTPSAEAASPEANSYDLIPYTSHPFTQSQPARLAAVAALFGLEVPDIRTARVLELGCAAGGNLIPFAANWPQSRCTGVDLSARQIADGQAIVAELGLANCDLRHASITDIDTSWGQFDYIICHGVWSWVPEAVRNHIFQVCRDNLAEHGVAYISYNTYPGWHMRGAIRDLMRWHAGGLADPQQKAQQARAVLQFLCDATPPEGDPYGLMLRNEARLLAQQGDYYLLHDHLEEVNHPVYVHEFFAQCVAHGLEYLAEAEVPTMLPTGLPAATVETLRRIAPDIVRMEQYLDFLRNRTFRQTLLVHQGRTINRNLTPQSLQKLAFASAAQPVGAVDPLAAGNAQFALPNGVQIGTVNPLTKAALLHLAQAFPQPVSFDDLLDAARQRLQPSAVSLPDPAARPADATALGADLLQLILAGAIEIWPALSLPVAPVITATPHGWPLARLQASRIAEGAAGVVTGMRHDNVPLDPFAARVLALLDGRHDRPAILDALEPLFAAGKLVVNRDGKPVTDPVIRRGMLVTLLDDTLHRLRRFGLLVKS